MTREWGDVVVTRSRGRREIAGAVGRLAVIAAAAVALVACGGSTAEPGPVLPTVTFAELESNPVGGDAQAAILDGTVDEPEYNSDPPTSGSHADDWADCGVYRVEIPNIYQVHSLKRGTVIIQYSPTIQDATRAALEDVVRSLGSDAIVAPRSGLPSPVVVTAWGTLMELTGADTESIERFHAEFAGQAPVAAECPLTVSLAE